jgi:Domain of unknown function (DUF4186)
MKAEQPNRQLIEALREQIRQKTIELAEAPAGVGLVPLRIACAMTSCQHGRHCLDHIRRPRGSDSATDRGYCRDCRQHVVDLPDQGGRRYGDVSEQIETCLDQQNELIRAHYWRVPIDLWALNRARRLGMQELRQRTAVRIQTALVTPGPFTGRTASYSGDAIAYAQHATATCCRRCAAYWHGFPVSADQVPTTPQVHHAITLAVAYLTLRLPDVPELGESGVPQIKSELRPSAREDAEADDLVFETLTNHGDPAGLLMPERTTLQLADTRSRILIARKMPMDQRGA